MRGIKRKKKSEITNSNNSNNNNKTLFTTLYFFFEYEIRYKNTEDNEETRLSGNCCCFLLTDTQIRLGIF